MTLRWTASSAEDADGDQIIATIIAGKTAKRAGDGAPAVPGGKDSGVANESHCNTQPRTAMVIADQVYCFTSIKRLYLPCLANTRPWATPQNHERIATKCSTGNVQKKQERLCRFVRSDYLAYPAGHLVHMLEISPPLSRHMECR